jgi:Cdc6-like AAA superfamily ATPase
VTAHHADLNQHLEERTYSTLQPQRVDLNPYTEKQAYEILADRAEKALKPQSLHREALNHIVSRTQNLRLALTWLRAAAEKAEDTITESLVNKVRKTARKQYVQNQLDRFSSEHKTLYRIVAELAEDSNSVSTGAVYREYQNKSDSPLSNRRISDLLKQLEQLNLITADYHYGGSKGKTREIELVKK